MTINEQRLLVALKKASIPHGEVLVRLIYQDGVVVRIVVEDKKESIKV